MTNRTDRTVHYNAASGYYSRPFAFCWLDHDYADADRFGSFVYDLAAVTCKECRTVVAGLRIDPPTRPGTKTKA